MSGHEEPHDVAVSLVQLAPGGGFDGVQAWCRDCEWRGSVFLGEAKYPMARADALAHEPIRARREGAREATR